MAVTLGMANAHGPASVTNDVIMRTAGLVTAGTGRRYGVWQRAWVASATATLVIHERSETVITGETEN